MSQKLKKQSSPAPVADKDEELAPITAMMSSRLMVLANLLKRGAILRYKRLVGLSSVEFGLVASLGRRPPMSVIRLAEAVGMDKGQISRALAELVTRKLVAKEVNPRDNRETLVCLTKAGLAAHDTIVAGAQERTVIPTTCFWLQDKWEKLGGGMARIHVFDSRLNAGSYILKQSGFEEGIGGDTYESAKFSNKACELMLADRVWKVAGWRSEYEKARLARSR